MADKRCKHTTLGFGVSGVLYCDDCDEEWHPAYETEGEGKRADPIRNERELSNIRATIRGMATNLHNMACALGDDDGG